LKERGWWWWWKKRASLSETSSSSFSSFGNTHKGNKESAEWEERSVERKPVW
jgi:hypothetical protein